MADRRRTTERGYGAEHKAEKERWRPIVNAGDAYCAEALCLEERDGRGRWIRPGTPWHLAHAVGQVGYLGPAHRRCNIAESNERRRGRTIARAVVTSTLWWRP